MKTNVVIVFWGRSVFGIAKDARKHFEGMPIVFIVRNDEPEEVIERKKDRLLLDGDCIMTVNAWIKKAHTYDEINVIANGGMTDQLVPVMQRALNAPRERGPQKVRLFHGTAHFYNLQCGRKPYAY